MTGTDRLSDLNLGMGIVIKVDKVAWRLAASSCNAFAVTAFSRYHLHAVIFL